MKILVIGATGLVGEQVYKACMDRDWDVHGTYLTQKVPGMVKLDVTDKNSVKSVLSSVGPDYVVHTAALTHVDYCEENRGEAGKINIEGTKNVVDAASDAGAKVVFMSTDYVFDGKNGPYSEKDEPNPVNYYGETKLEGEKLVMNHGGSMVVRSCWIFDMPPSSLDTKNFVFRLVGTLSNGKEISVPTDQIANPTKASHLGRSIAGLIDKSFSGIINLSGSSRMSKYDFAVCAAERFGLDANLIKGVSSESLGQKADRPKKSGFVLDLAEKELGKSMKSLDAYLKDLEDG